MWLEYKEGGKLYFFLEFYVLRMSYVNNGVFGEVNILNL